MIWFPGTISSNSLEFLLFAWFAADHAGQQILDELGKGQGRKITDHVVAMVTVVVW